MSIETMLLREITKIGLPFEKVIDGGRIHYDIAGTSYLLKQAADEFLDGGWDNNYHDVSL